MYVSCRDFKLLKFAVALSLHILWSCSFASAVLQSHGQGPSGGQVGPGQVGPVTGSSSQSKAMAKGPLAGRLAQGRLAQKQALLLRAKPWLRALWRAGWPWADRPGKRW